MEHGKLEKNLDLFLVLVLTATDRTDDPRAFMHGRKAVHGFFRDLAGDDKKYSRCRKLKNLEHFRPRQAALLAQPMEHGLHVPRIEIDVGREPNWGGRAGCCRKKPPPVM